MGRSHAFNRIVEIVAAVALALTSPSCAHKKIVGDIVTRNSELTTPRYEFNFSDPQSLRRELQKIGPLNKRANQDLLVEILVAFNGLARNLKTGKIEFLPRSKTKLKLFSFCASSRKAIPEKNEIFKWIKGVPQIPFIGPVLDFYAQAQVKDHGAIQELLWNIENKTYYEDYPNGLKNIIDTISPSAKLTLPSRARDRVLEEIVPEDLKDSMGLILRKYYSLEEFRSSLEQKKSAMALPKDYFASAIPATDLLASTVSNGYEFQIVTFYNPSGKTAYIKITDFYMQPVRADVQPVVMAAVLPGLEEMQKILEEYSLKMLGYLGSQYPTLNPTEKKLVREKPISAAIAYYHSRIAESEGERFFPGTSESGPADAFRHYVWAGLLVRELGESDARKFLAAHEQSEEQSPEEKEMDTFNNERGIQSAIRMLKDKKFENSELFDQARDEIRGGKFKILKQYEK